MIQQLTDDYHANLRVGASLTIGEYLLPSLLGKFKKQKPEIKVTLTIKNTALVLEDLSNDVIDLALVEGAVENTDFIVEKFAEDELILVCSPDHPWKDRKEIQIEELGNERMIWRESTSGTRHIVESKLREYGVLEKIRQLYGDWKYASDKKYDRGWTWNHDLPRLTVARELEQGFLREVDISGVKITRNLWLVKKNQRFNKVEVDNFVQFIQ